MVAYPLVAPYFTGIDANGAPLAGGKVYTYASGTTTPQDSYTSYTAGTPAANPVILDSAGRATIWLSGSYKIVVQDSLGNQIASVDNISQTQSTPTELNYLSGVTPGTASASKAVVLDSSLNVTGLATNTFNTASTGIANMAAVQGSMTGGFINKFRNAGFDIAQRGASGTTTSSTGVYTLDGWILGSDGTRILTWAQNYTHVNNFGNFLQLSGAAGTTATFIRQRIESSIVSSIFPGPVTVQITWYNSTGASVTPTLTVKNATVQDNWGATVTLVNAVALQPTANNTQQTLAYTFSTAAGGAQNGLEVTWNFGTGFGAGSTAYFSNPDIRVATGVTIGLNAMPPTPEVRPIAIEVPYCQRYLPSFGTIAGPIGTGAATSTSASGYFIPFSVPTRIAPTGLTVTTVGDFEVATFANADVAALTGMTFGQASPNGVFVTAAVSGTPLTSAVSYMLYAKTALAGNLIFTGAEL